MRDLVMAIGGPLRADENRKSWLRRVARQAGITPWQAKAAWYGLFREPEEQSAIWKMRALVQQQQREDADARDEFATIKARLAVLESRFAAQEAHGDRETDHGAHPEMHRTR